MARRKQSPEELKAHLEQSIGFLRISARLFDEGTTSEAKRLSTELRKLLHDTDRSKSLLGLLKMKGGQFLDTARIIPNFSPQKYCYTPAYYGLILLDPASGRCVAPMQTAAVRRANFINWWEAIAFRGEDGTTLSRADVVLKTANQDGGAHVDPKIDEKYDKFTRTNLLGLFFSNSYVRGGSSTENWSPFTGAVLTAVRQIAHEVLETIRPGYLGWALPPSGPTLQGEMTLEFDCPPPS